MKNLTKFVTLAIVISDRGVAQAQRGTTTQATTTESLGKAARNLIFVDDILRTYQKPSQVAIILEQSIKQSYLFYLSALNYGEEWKLLFDDGYFNDTDIEVITHDLRVLLEELEFFAQWMIRDAEDLVHPWVNWTSRDLVDQYIFNFTFGAGELIEITGQTTFRTYKIVEEAARDVERWIASWSDVANGGTFTFSYVSSMFRDVRTWMELLLEDLRICSLKLEQVFAVWGIDWSTNYILKQSMEWVVLVIDLIDEMVEFVNLAFAAVLEPIIGLIQAGNPDQIVNIPV